MPRWGDPGAASARAVPEQRARSFGRALGLEHTQVLVTERLLVDVHTFRGSTVVAPSGLIGRQEWRELSTLMRNLDASRFCVLDLIHVLDVNDSVLLTLLAARRQRRFGGLPFILWNLPRSTG